MFFISIFFTPNISYAGELFAFLPNFFIGDSGSAFAQENPSKNVWNMDLLKTNPNPDPGFGKGGSEVTIVDGSALFAESGSLGTIADIENNRHPSNISIYIVKEGDTLSEIAKMFDVSVNTIKWANNTSSSIKLGQVLVILPVSGIKHTILKGDTINSIAKKYKANAIEITQFNGLKEDSPLVLGEVLIIPDGVATAPSYAFTGSNNMPTYEGYYLRPISGGRKTQGIHGYNGVDLAAPYGSSVWAAAPGTVIVARDWGWNGGYGNYIVISHPNGTQTLYSHLDDVMVVQGETVNQGQIIGTIGMTGKTTGPHVHFEIRGAKNSF